VCPAAAKRTFPLRRTAIMTRWLPAHVCLLLLFALSLGCTGGSGPVKVNGTVTLDGKPLSNAMIVFNPDGEGGTPASGVSGSDGSFRLTTFNSGDGAKPGNYKVTVALTPEEEVGGAPPTPGDPKAMAEAMRKYAESHKKKTVKKTGLPASYSDPGKTALKYTIPPPDGKVVLELRSSGS
jgi:hypothetical protein